MTRAPVVGGLCETEYRPAHPARLTSRVAKPKVIDVRGTLTADNRRGAGWIYRALGRP